MFKESQKKGEFYCKKFGIDRPNPWIRPSAVATAIASEQSSDSSGDMFISKKKGKGPKKKKNVPSGLGTIELIPNRSEIQAIAAGIGSISTVSSRSSNSCMLYNCKCTLNILIFISSPLLSLFI